MNKTSKDKRVSRKRKRILLLIYCIVFFAFSTLVFKISKDAVTKVWESSNMSALGNKTKSSLSKQKNLKEKNNLSSQDKKSWNLVLANPSTVLPEDFSVNLTQLSNGQQIDSRAYNDLQNMMDDARKEGLSPMICSSYRTMDFQQQLFNQEVNTYIGQNYSQEESKKKAAQWVAIPGTSEHQTGLALDIVSSSYQLLNKEQENTPEQKWLIKNSYKYGFILRYPSDKTHITGIEYEPWHYRYVGKEAAKEITERGFCLEEYLK
jgi:zinc D-Ala-D-Ala carboxypeptidase